MKIQVINAAVNVGGKLALKKVCECITPPPLSFDGHLLCLITMSMLQFCFAWFSPRWLAACPGERSGQRRWQQSLHTPCSQAESGPHSHRSTQTPPGIRRGEGEWRRLLLLGLPTDALSFGCEATLTSIVTLRSQADAGTFLLQLFSLSTRRGGSGANILKCNFAVDAWLMTR